MQAQFKRAQLSPSSDITSPEHKRHDPGNVPLRSNAPPLAPEHRGGPSERFGTFTSYTTMLRRGEASGSRSQQSASTPTAPTHQQSVQAPSGDVEMDSESDAGDRESSPDPIDFLSHNADALIADSVAHMAGMDSDYLSYEDALNFALQSAADNGFPSEPEHWKDIKNRPDASKWYAAAQEEFQALLDNGTFEPVQLPKGRKAIGCRWVFKLKRKADGTVDKYKARLVAKGFSQCPGLDFGQVFAPTARWAALRAIFVLVALEDLELYSVDVSNAFLNGDLDHEVYMAHPEGFEERFDHGTILQLHKALYGLKQAGHQWHKKLNQVLTSIGFTLVRCDNSIWVFKRASTRIIIPVYVDDMTIACNKRTEYEQVVGELKKHFKIKELGETSSLLGVLIERDRSKHRLCISQKHYAEDVLERFNLSNMHPVSTPLDTGLRLSKDQAPQTHEERSEMSKLPYSQLVGALMYLAIATRPDIAHAVGVLSRFSSNPGIPHWKALKHLCRYVQGTKDFKLCYEPDPTCKEPFSTYADADYAGDIDTRRSTSGMVVKMGTGAISWASKLQPVVTLSTTEAEYISATSAAQEILWLRNLFQEIGYEIEGASSLYLDNQSAIAVSKNPEYHGRMKHLDLRHYWLRDVVKEGKIDVKYIPTASMPADIMTKSLPKATVELMRKMHGLEK